MIVSLNWLKRYVAFDLDARELALRLTDSLTEAEAVPSPWAGVAGVVAAKVVTVETHPNADKLKVCVVDWGGGSSTVVCGAPNVRAGMTSVLAPPGATIAGGHKIGEAKIRGRRSHGMLVSAQELGLEESSEGILELDAESVEPGGDVVSLLGLDDEIIDLDVQPNRPDCLGVIGVAREVAAITGSEFRLPDLGLPEEGPAASELCAVEIEDLHGCPRYIARVISDVVTGPSPAWLQAALRSVGSRSISNIVDITNFVMLEWGHPIHAFDYDRLADHKIVVRRANAGEKMTTLDGIEHDLNTEHLLICDGREAVALAGIMGGLDSEVEDTTRNILLEVAWFDPVVVRRGARALGVRTDASQRFEHGIDPHAMDSVAARACSLMASLAEGSVAPGTVDAGRKGDDPVRITLDVEKVTSMLGSDVGRDESVGALGSLGFGVDDAESGRLSVEVPSYRSDVTVAADLIEEVLRSRGYEGVPPCVPFHSIDAPPDEGSAARNRVLDAMVRLGFTEVKTTCFMSPRAIERLGGPSVWGEPIELSNPFNKELPLMRTAVLPSLLDVVRRNRNVGERDLRLFEIGKVFTKEGKGYGERWVLAGAMTGAAARHVWGSESRSVDFFDGKGALWALAEALDVDTPEVACYDGELLEKGACSGLTVGGAELGPFGMLSKKVLSAWEMTDPVFVFEIDLDGLCGHLRGAGAYEELPRYPKSRRDVALVVDERTAAGDVLGAVRGMQEPLLVDVRVFDVFRGEQLPSGKKSLAFGMTYMSRERTLKDEEVDGAHTRIVEHLMGAFDATVR